MHNYYVAYQDMGPSGACGQTVKNTAPWCKLYVFNDEVEAREFVSHVVLNPFKMGRLRPKIIGFWSDDPMYNNVDDKRGKDVSK